MCCQKSRHGWIGCMPLERRMHPTSATRPRLHSKESGVHCACNYKDMQFSLIWYQPSTAQVASMKWVGASCGWRPAPSVPRTLIEKPPSPSDTTAGSCFLAEKEEEREGKNGIKPTKTKSIKLVHVLCISILKKQKSISLQMKAVLYIKTTMQERRCIYNLCKIKEREKREGCIYYLDGSSAFDFPVLECVFNKNKAINISRINMPFGCTPPHREDAAVLRKHARDRAYDHSTALYPRAPG